MSDEEAPRAERRLTAEEAAFIKNFAVDALAGRHVLCLIVASLLAIGKVAAAMAIIGTAVVMALGWRAHT